MKTQIYPINQLTPTQLADVARAVKGGALAALATDTVYGLAASAFEEKAIQRIYTLKERPAGMPLQILIGCVAAAREIVCWNDGAEKLASAYWPGALTMILPANEKGQPLLRGAKGLGLRVPKHAGLLQFLKVLDAPLACTSANAHGKPVITTQEDLISFCGGKVEFILTDGTLSPVASSVVDMTGAPALLREGALPRRALENILNQRLK